jgi:phage-related protein
LNFYLSKDKKVQTKINYVFDLVRYEPQVPIKFFKKLEGWDGLFEIRVITAQLSIRILCFLDEGRLVVLTNGFLKKTQKTPRKEIELAIRLREEYLKEKKNENKNF